VTKSIFAFMAVKEDLSLVPYGFDSAGNHSNSTLTAISQDVFYLAHSALALAVLKSNGSVVTWDDSVFGERRRGCAD
jgi:hypothetical protein